MQNVNEIIDAYANGGPKLKQALAGLTDDDLRAVPVEGKWSIQHLAIHLADAELAFADRIKRVIATDNPALAGWDESAYGATLYYADQSAHDAAEEVDVARRQIVRILRKLPPAAFERAGVHSERGPMTLFQIVSLASSHLDRHLTFLYEKREKLGKLMW